MRNTPKISAKINDDPFILAFRSLKSVIIYYKICDTLTCFCYSLFEGFAMILYGSLNLDLHLYKAD